MNEKENEQEIELIRQYTQKEISQDDIYTFNVQLCNNDIDRDGERFSVETLKQLAKLFKGKTGIFDHSMKAENQKARIFDAWVEKSNDKKAVDGKDFYLLKAKAYMVKSDENKNLIREIEAGIKKEVSVSCKTEKSICSICGADRYKTRCEHIRGRVYKNKTCYFTLENATDAYEWSFVAVPAQREAGVTKSYAQFETDFKNFKNISEEEITISKETAKSIAEKIEKLEKENTFINEYRQELAKDILKYFSANLPEMNIETIASVTNIMTTKEMSDFRNAIKKKNAKVSAKSQLMPEIKKTSTKYSQFKI